MARNSRLLKLRDANVRKRYEELIEEHPKWRNDAIIEEIVNEFFISARTVSAILNDEGIYGINPIPLMQLALF